MTLRFCFLTTFYPPYSFGGDAIAVQRLANALVRRGHHVTVIHDADAHAALRHGPAPPRDYDHGPVAVVTLESGLRLLSPLLTQQTGHPVVHGRRIRQIVEEGRFDVINFHNVSLVGGPGLLSYGTAAKIYMAHEHWLVCPTHTLWRHRRELCDGRECVRCTLRHRRPPQIWRYTGFLERQLRHVDAFVAMTEFSRRKHLEFGFPRTMEVIPQFLPDPDPPGPPQGRPHARPYFLFAGRLEQIKGLQDVIPAFASDGDVDLLVAGTGNHEATLRQIAAERPRVRFVGHVPSVDLARFYRHAIATIVPSIGYETFGLTLIESFRHGTPVIARRLGSFPEIVEQSHGGKLFDKEDELLGAIRHLAENRGERDRCGRNGFDAYRRYWSEGAVVPRYLELVQNVLERRQPSERARQEAVAVAGLPE